MSEERQRRRRRPPGRRAGVAAALAVLALAAGSLGAFAGPAVAAPPASGGLPAATQVHAPVPRLAWTDCGDGLQCATARVPLDYDRPTGPTITLALAKLPATDPAHRIGTLFINPGGPGGSGVGFVRSAASIYDPAVLARFDVVGFDPRGVAGSTPVRCFDSAAEQAQFFADVPPFPVRRAEVARYIRTYVEYGRRCAATAGPILRHMSTANVARDLDLLRQAVGDRQLTYAGYSYGTYLGNTYANMFPGRVRAMLIDAVLDPERWATGQFGDGFRVPFSTRLHSDDGAFATLGAFFRTCTAAGDRCAFSAGDPAAKYAALARRLRREPLVLTDPGGSTFTVTYAVLVDQTLGALYAPAQWPDLAGALQQLTDLADPAARPAAVSSGTRALLGGFDGRPGYRAGAAEEVPFDDAFAAVSCSETDNPTNPAAWPRAAAAADRRFPYFGREWTYVSQACATWPAHDADRYAGPFDHRTANPVLVVGTRFDPATRYQAAVEVSRELPGARLLTLDGYGHAAVAKSACIDAAEARYFVDGELPAAGTVCPSDRQPFDPAPTAATARAAARVAAQDAVVAAARRATVPVVGGSG